MIVKVKYETRDKHVYARLFMGPEISHLTMCGSLVFKHAEFDVWIRCLKDGALLVKDAEVVIVDARDGSSSSFPRISPPFDKT